MSGKVIETSEKVMRMVFGLFLAKNPEYSSILETCESPIEELFATAIMFKTQVWERSTLGPDATFDADAIGLSLSAQLQPSIMASLIGDSYTVFMLQQPKIQCDTCSLRADFAIVAAIRWPDSSFYFVGSKVAVELDGHEWHERTKEQARADKQRDRVMQSFGWNVLRFTGSEVYENAMACLDESVRTALSIATEKMATVLHVDHERDVERRRLLSRPTRHAEPQPPASEATQASEAS